MKLIQSLVVSICFDLAMIALLLVFQFIFNISQLVSAFILAIIVGLAILPFTYPMIKYTPRLARMSIPRYHRVQFGFIQLSSFIAVIVFFFAWLFPLGRLTIDVIYTIAIVAGTFRYLYKPDRREKGKIQSDNEYEPAYKYLDKPW